MRWITRIFKSRLLFIVFGLLLLISLILIAGSRFGLSKDKQLIIIIIVLFVGVLLLLIKQMKANREAALLEQSIKAQAEEQKLALRPEKREEIEELKLELSSAIESLKKSKLGKGRSGRTALYALPWYMFIGPPAAGKTTAIVNSGLEFPFGSDIKGVGGTRNCDWFFSNSAILLDTAGRYVTEEEDREEWHAFLDILKKYRRRNPINGVVIGMSITDVVNASIEDLEWHAKNIRHRIDELIQRLGIRFPVYLVFTKCDLLQGFVEIFEDLSRKEREQVWGCTLQQNVTNHRETFDEEFQILTKSLEDIRIKRLCSPTKPENRSKVFVFPLEFTSIKENVGHFIGKLFQPTPYKESPFFRGFYFTSGTQEGIPIDRVIQVIEKQFDLPSELTSEPGIEKKTYFIKQLFTEVIIPDKNMVTKTSRAAIQSNFARIFTVAASVIVLGAFILGISLAYVRSKIDLNAVNGAAKKMEEVRWDSGASFSINFKHMKRLSKHITEFEQDKPNTPFILSGMYRGNLVLPASRELYHKKVNPFIERNLHRELYKRLVAYKNGALYPRTQIKNYLKAYLLMGSEIVRLDTSNENFLIKELLSIYGPFMPLDEELRTLIENQIEFFVRSLGKEGMPEFTNDKNLIRFIQTLIYEEPSIYGIYTRIKSEAGGIPSFNLTRAIGEGYNDILVSADEVLGFFTKLGWETFVEEAIESESKNPRTDWVLGEQQPLSPDMRDPKKMAEELQRIYFKEYAESWWQFLQSIQYRPFESLLAATDSLKKLGNPSDSPLIPLFNNVTKQTRFESEISRGVAKKVADSGKNIAQKVGLAKKTPPSKDPLPSQSINEQFGRLFTLSTDAGDSADASSDLPNILSQYANIGTALEQILTDPGIKAKDNAARVLQQGTGELPNALGMIRVTLNKFDLTTKQALKILFEQPVKNAWAVIVNEAQSHLNSLWQNKVYQPFQLNLANYYPFNPQGQDASIVDVEAFFEPQNGILWKFFEEELKPFIRPDSWSANTWEEFGIVLSPETINALDYANAISSGLFTQGILKVNFRLQPDQPTYIDSSPTIERISLTIDGKELIYRMGGQQWMDFSWPGQEGTPGASLKLILRDKDEEPKRYDGEWGWFRLLDIADIRPKSPLEFHLFWLFGVRDRYQVFGQVGVKYTLRASSVYNPFNGEKNLFKFRCPSKLN